jgi:glycosyltransferase involved in cell wall biosynthesis
VEKLASLLRNDLQPDVVHLSNILLLGLARPIRAATGAAIVSSLSGEDIFIGQLPPAHRDRVLGLLRERAGDVDRFVALNRAFADQMAPVLGVAAESIAVVPHGVDSSGFPATLPDLLARRRARDGRLRIGFLARACPEKGLDVLIRAVARMAATHDVTLVAAGAEIEAERPYLDRCRQLAAELGLADRFEWRGQVDRAGKLALLSEVDLFAMPTTHPEAKGIPVLEAFTAGLPVVASDHGAFPEYLGRDPATSLGLLCTPSDPAAFHAALLVLADDPGLLERMGRDAFAAARERFTPDAMAAGHEQLYAAALAARAR